MKAIPCPNCEGEGVITADEAPALFPANGPIAGPCYLCEGNGELGAETREEVELLADTHARKGLPIPTDLTAALLEYGLDPQAFEV